MIPFLKHSKEASVAVQSDTKRRTPDTKEEEYDSLESAIQELFDAQKSGDVKAGCIAMRSAFQILDSEPHVEGEHIEERE